MRNFFVASLVAYAFGASVALATSMSDVHHTAPISPETATEAVELEPLVIFGDRDATSREETIARVVDLSEQDPCAVPALIGVHCETVSFEAQHISAARP